MSKFFNKLEQLVASSTDDPHLESAADVLQDAGCSTASIAVLDNGEIISHCISSCGDDTDTLFQACSISKPTAGVAAMRLVDLGFFSVEDCIRDLLPNEIVKLLARDPRTEAAFNAVTVAHLMSHTAGLSVPSFPGYSDANHVPTVNQLLQGRENSNTMRIQFCSVPGADFIYSGGGITILQCLMEHATKMSFPALMQKHVFEPLGMTRSCYTLKAGENATRCFWNGYKECEAQWHYQPESGAAGLWTTPTDLLKLGRGVQKSLTGDGILRKATAERMLTRVTKDIALTWFVNSIGFGHSGGNFPGFRCQLIAYADLPQNGSSEPKPQIPQDCGMTVMTNSASANPAMWKLLHAISYLKSWPEIPLFFMAADYKAPFRSLETGYADSWKEWIGWWGKWQIAECSGMPVAGVDGVLLNLRPAAIPARHYGGGQQSIDLLLDGTEQMLRLGFDGVKRIVELWNGSMGTCETLKAITYA
ncbi:uncharacterized protein HMPREF1541_09387 [Cyphellophora europaea CBS 101466]|uniref:Beta-lactamase-related domain-containing protein n=1 Tax=Cyphellophora europaea (strain CBS 101466) TaxID=1220924 RepID=W2SA94_CYPE1|nr:uncharacterized protein HMPREF1541_09387 [Cyphellophora europaea CBS 101466]ETN45555.1 hypothetical protein HMPREF1541_09387 [Cyphellophora europaea CBS 101466]